MSLLNRERRRDLDRIRKDEDAVVRAKNMPRATALYTYLTASVCRAKVELRFISDPGASSQRLRGIRDHCHDDTQGVPSPSLPGEKRMVLRSGTSSDSTLFRKFENSHYFHSRGTYYKLIVTRYSVVV